MTASLVLTKFDEIFGCLHGNGAPFVGVVTFANTLYMKVILLEEIKAYAEKQGFKVAAMGAFPAAHTLSSALGSESRPNAEDEKLMLDFGRKVYEKVSSGDYVLHDKIGSNTSDSDAEKIASYRAVENGHSTFPPAYKAKAISDACIKCGACVRNCPVDAIDIEAKTFDVEKCIGCWACINRCPKHAITSTSKQVAEIMASIGQVATARLEPDLLFQELLHAQNWYNNLL